MYNLEMVKRLERDAIGQGSSHAVLISSRGLELVRDRAADSGRCN